MISRSKKITSTEKKLQALKVQLYGKEAITETLSPSSKTKLPQNTFSFKGGPAATQAPTPVQTSDIIHLQKDLLKTCYLAGGLIILQLAIYFSGLSSRLIF